MITRSLFILGLPLAFATGFSQTPTPAASTMTPEELVAARAIPYKPAIDRDPFKSPTELDSVSKGELLDDVAVKGVVKLAGKTMAVITDSRGNVRWLAVGYQFKDGRIAAIDDKSVTFHQWDPNSQVRSQYRTVVKTFKREEGKR
jgi:hypothetical protein